VNKLIHKGNFLDVSNDFLAGGMATEELIESGWRVSVLDWEFKTCDTNFLSLKTESPLTNVVFMYIIIRMSMVMKIMDFLVSVDQGYVDAMLSWNMMAFGWELVIIESEVNSSGVMSLKRE